ncbi:MAG: LacI family DNA-binding transcriptional regulator [Planctomycetota bacterium]
MADSNRHPKTVTIADIARQAEASPTTVSFVLNGRAAEKRIADATAARVLEVARAMRYSPNEMARSLRLQRTGDIGVILPHLLNDWAHYIMLGVEEVLDEAGFVPLIVNHRMSVDRSRRGLDSLFRRRVQGVLCSPMQHEVAHYRDVIGRGMPVVFLGDVPTDMPEATFAAWDPAEVALPVRHLAEAGRRRMLFLGHTDDRRLTRERYNAVRRATAEAGLATADELFVLRPSEAGFDAELREIFTRWPMARRPDAIYALYDEIAMNAIDHLSGFGLNVPGDVAVTATGTGLNAGYRSYGLTVMKAPVAQEGAAAARLLVQRIQDPVRAVESVYVSGGELVPGHSTLGASAERLEVSKAAARVKPIKTRPVPQNIAGALESVRSTA